MSSSLEKAIEVIDRVAKPDKIILFGSRARGDHKAASDYDLLVLKRGVEQRRKLVQNIYLSFKNIGAPVDVIVTDLHEYERSKDDPYLIYSKAARNGRVVYERC
ncbi:MAG TPA: nucleotidyltransferase domain-containing protein [Candidatus Aminicenantes bacterium]|nr:nucleotidyltransferase domain-containing protein [Candidatus Aminicenantes bacterium]